MPKFADGHPFKTKISRTELVEALGNQQAFDKLYIEMTQRAIDMYAKGHRRKFALKLHGSLAALDLYVPLSTYSLFDSDPSWNQPPWPIPDCASNIHFITGALHWEQVAAS